MSDKVRQIAIACRTVIPGSDHSLKIGLAYMLDVETSVLPYQNFLCFHSENNPTLPSPSRILVHLRFVIVPNKRKTVIKDIYLKKAACAVLSRLLNVSH